MSAPQWIEPPHDHLRDEIREEADHHEDRRQHGLPGAFNPTLNCLPDGVPHGGLLPEPFKILHTPGIIIMLYEVETTFRQIFMDGRTLPADPSRTWQGYSVGRWEGDTLVVETAGFNDLGWLDALGIAG